MLIFDGHNDVLTDLFDAGGVPAAATFLSGMSGHLDAARAAAGGFGGGFFAMWVASPGAMDFSSIDGDYDLPPPDEIAQDAAWRVARMQADIFLELQRFGALNVCGSVTEIEAARRQGKIAAILHLEGAEPISDSLRELDVLYDLGLRSLGPVWSRPNRFGHGVPFRYPSDGDTGPGLSAAGHALVEKCNEMRVMIDLSHLNMAGVRDVAAISNAPLVATHSNAHAVSPHARNLTDTQLALIAQSGGVVGLNFESTFLRSDGQPKPDIPEAAVMAHLDHLLGALGEEGVALGSDFDGCTPPLWLNGAENLPTLIAAMERHGYTADRIERICWSNWMRVLRDTWGG
ncbi:membrane dipeptidase [Ruegeria sp. 2205SS24-7]|uniref:dipeptidase n=1 Tax=Ruegeria discodermiae TaxID=3064389 RepID=UPI002741E7A4|nr:membrane dipeptidase [Ruegeria sp. 2205SS24-7]MDP5216823.1 membrane dipeptidase [Ruegeria sp. 2205SS24-7]